MKWSVRFGSIAGIDLYVHLTFPLLLLWMGAIHYQQSGTVSGVLWALFLTLLLFSVVILHELAHALTARRFGVRTRDITLLPIGGMARLERMPEKPRQELLVALAGPAVNVLLVVVLLAAALVIGRRPTIPQSGIFQMPVLEFLIWINAWLAVFNLLPAFPMDGGRVLRALLAMRMDYVRATRIAAYTGQATALLFGFVGLFAGPVLILIALFVWMGAAGEASMVRMKSAMGGVPISRAMVTQFKTLPPHASLSDAIEGLLAGFQQDFPVVHEGELIGLLTRSELVKAVRRKGDQARVEDVMETKFEIADPSEMMETVFERLKICRCRSLPVLREGRLVGIVTMDNLSEFLMVARAYPGVSQT